MNDPGITFDLSPAENIPEPLTDQEYHLIQAAMGLDADFISPAPVDFKMVKALIKYIRYQRHLLDQRTMPRPEKTAAEILEEMKFTAADIKTLVESERQAIQNMEEKLRQRQESLAVSEANLDLLRQTKQKLLDT